MLEGSLQQPAGSLSFEFSAHPQPLPGMQSHEFLLGAQQALNACASMPARFQCLDCLELFAILIG